MPKTYITQGYAGCYHHPCGPYFMLKEETGKLQVVFGPQGDLYSKVSNVGNVLYPNRYPDDLAYILDLPISENIDLSHEINALCISDHKGSFSRKSNPHISAS